MKGDADLDRNNFNFLCVVLASIVLLAELPAFAFLSRHCPVHVTIPSLCVIGGMRICRSYTRPSSAVFSFEKHVGQIYPVYIAFILISALGLSLLRAVPRSVCFVPGFWEYPGTSLLSLDILAPVLPAVIASNTAGSSLGTPKIEVTVFLFTFLLPHLCNLFWTKLTARVTFILSSIWKFGFLCLAVIHNAETTYTGKAPRNIYRELEVRFLAHLPCFLASLDSIVLVPVLTLWLAESRFLFRNNRCRHASFRKPILVSAACGGVFEFSS